MTTIVSTVPFTNLRFFLDYAGFIAASDTIVEEFGTSSHVVSSATSGITWRATGVNFTYAPLGLVSEVLVGGTVTGIEVTVPGGGYEVTGTSFAWAFPLLLGPTGAPMFDGDDTITGSESGAGLTPGVNDLILGLDGNDTIDGRGGNDAISGGNGIDDLDGGAGNDAISGDAGSDTMRGGPGDDTYIVDNAGDVVDENGGSGTDLVSSSRSFSLSDAVHARGTIENLILTGTAVSGTGNGVANLILGNDSNNTLDGRTGADTMLGGPGNDTYVVDNAGDVATEPSGYGTDLVKASISFTLPANVENLMLTGGGAVNGTGNTLANVITGNAGANKLSGLGGGDTLEGNAGNDDLDGGSGADTMRGGAQNDTYVVNNDGDKAIESSGQGTDLVKSSVSFTLGADVENLTLTGSGAVNGTGNTLANVIIGNGGANRINGGISIDTLTGGAGPDTFVFDASVSAKTTAAAADNADIVTDFSPADDTIELAAAVFPKLKLGVLKNKAFDSGKKKPSKDKHAVYYDEKTGELFYDANGKKQKGKGDVLIATLDPGLDLTAGDIVVA